MALRIYGIHGIARHGVRVRGHDLCVRGVREVQGSRRRVPRSYITPSWPNAERAKFMQVQEAVSPQGVRESVARGVPNDIWGQRVKCERPTHE